MKTCAAVALLVVVTSSSSLAEPAGRLTVWVRGPRQLVAGGPAAVRIGTQRSRSRTEVAPWPDAKVELTLEGKGRRAVLGSSVADGSGEASVRFLVPDWPDGEYSLVVNARDPAGEARPTSERSPVELSPSARLLLQSDKPLYQPGQIVHFKVLAMRPFDAKPLSRAKVSFEVYDPRDNRVFLEERVASEFGIAAADFELGPEVTLGTWKAKASSSAPGAAPAELELKVERYALPKFKVALETDRGWYRPSSTVKLSVESRYFFDKPVAKGAVLAKLTTASDVRAVLQEAHATLDAQGRGTLELQLPRDSAGAFAVQVEVTDSAAHVERATRQVPVVTQGLQVELVTQRPALVAGVKNELWVVAARPDGAALEGATVELAVGDGPAQAQGRTDALGIAEVGFRPIDSLRCLKVRAQVTQAGETVSDERCLPVVSAPPGPCALIGCEGWPLLLRTDRSLYPAGAPMVIEVLAPGAAGTVLVDVVKDALTVDTARVELVEGRGVLTLPPDERRFGALQLQASWAGASGRGPSQRRAHDQRMIYVERPATLAVTAKATRPGEASAPTSFSPGEAAQLSFKVVNAASGAPVRASVGVVMVDQALLALRPVRPSMAKAYFHLSQAATKQARVPKVRPAGLGLPELVERGVTDDASNLAARVLLASAQPPWDVGLETDGFSRLVEEADAQASRLTDAMARYASGHLLGERVPGTKAWRWRRALVAQLVADGALRPSDARDPWGSAIPVSALTSDQGEFSEWADLDIGERLTRVYEALNRALKAGRLTVSKDVKPIVTLTGEDLLRLELQPAFAVDTWGNPWRVVERPKLRWIAGIRSKQVIVSDGPDGKPGTADDRYPADSSSGGVLMVQGAIGDAVGYGGLGLRGVGAGGYGSGVGVLGGHVARTVAVAMSLPSVRGPGGRTPAKVRSDFPETLLWRPELLTDAQGEARLDVTLADSITTWVLSAEAVDAEGRLGHASLEVRVMQDFFADLDLPPVMTQHDELSVPVAVYNYLKVPQRVSLRLEEGDGFELLGPAGDRLQTIDLAAGEVGVRFFRVAAQKVGRRALTVHAESGSVKDSVRREVEVFPDGLERVTAWQDRLTSEPLHHQLIIPASAISGTPRATFKLYPGLGAQVIDGMENMLRMPSGCFEQSSSTTYPNALILDYLRKTKKATPEVEARARKYLAAGYQKLVSFEVRGGGFSWFGDAPANKVLTAYGLEEFVDMAKVYPVDPRLIERTRAWLLARQNDDGHWEAEPSPINEGATNHFERDSVRTTAYLALALQRAGAPRERLLKAARWISRHLGADADAYTLALANELLGRLGAPGLTDRLWALHKSEARGVLFPEGQGGTLTYGSGKSGDVETTARAALSLLSSGGQSERVSQALAYLVANKDALGNWYSTQATIRSLQALLEYEAARGRDRTGTVSLAVDGKEVASLEVVGAHQLAQTVELPAEALSGEHDVTVDWKGTGELTYQLVSRYFEPRPPAPAEAARPAPFFTVGTELSKETVKVGGEVQATVVVTSRDAVAMPVVKAGLPPGFHVDDASLEKLVLQHKIDKYERGAREIVFYLTRLDPHVMLQLDYTLVARMPAQVQVPAPSVYEYYRPENAAEGAPVKLSSTL